MARVEAKLASAQSEAKEKGKLRNEPFDRSTRLFVGMALQSVGITSADAFARDLAGIL